MNRQAVAQARRSLARVRARGPGNVVNWLVRHRFAMSHCIAAFLAHGHEPGMAELIARQMGRQPEMLVVLCVLAADVDMLHDDEQAFWGIIRRRMPRLGASLQLARSLLH
jgi:hypothetical protein